MCNFFYSFVNCYYIIIIIIVIIIINLFVNIENNKHDAK